MPIELYRIDDRLIHGQVVVGWGQPLDLQRIILVDDEVAASEWEQELYRMGVPPEMDVHFLDVATAAAQLPALQRDLARSIVLVGSVATMAALVADSGNTVPTINLGGVHHAAGRTQRMRYVFLTDDEEQQLRALASRGVTITAQDVPAARPIPLEQVLDGRGDG
ncbi:MAG: PTS sugar transporter subunit IIB [Gemmatimonadaceae bacterium]|jgi:PTS system mannose-specific IIB component/fructoselysine and glucoselysine-specific PTS system IIB component|nr:PTS sugar transporter subunit IIB [Gemmatimonadaceae bacterium]